MKKSLFIIPSLLLLAGCFEERKNPLLEADSQDLLRWFHEIETKEMKACAPFWAHPDKAPPNAEDLCAAEKERVVSALNQAKFMDAKVILEDMESPTPWLHYEDSSKYKKIFEPLPKENYKKPTPEEMQKQQREFWRRTEEKRQKYKAEQDNK